MHSNSNASKKKSMVEPIKWTIQLDTVSRPEVNQQLLEKRYLKGNEKTWEDVVVRVSSHAGEKAGRQDEFFTAIHDFKFLPSRMTYMGTEYAFASSCFVLPVDDSLAGIMETLTNACQVQKYGGGTGYNFSRLRPKGDIIKTSGGDASGPVSFMGLYHNAMEVVNRAGKKHAAQMGILNCDHPDILKFIQSKDQEGAFWTFNISVAVTDEFMQAVRHDQEWDLQYEGKVYETLRARTLWGYIVQHAWHNGDPGVIFIDSVNKHNRYPEPIEACNPCGEQMLPPYVSCNLGSIDLSRFVTGGQINWDSLESVVRTGIRFLDGSLDAAFWPVKKIQKKTLTYRNIGLGVMGWADMLIYLGIPYDSEAAIELADQVMGFINKIADNESHELGGGKRLNTTVTSIAPTGSISLLAGCSSGIEPLFGIMTTKNTYVGSYHNVHWMFEAIAKKRGFFNDDVMGQIANTGSIQHVDDIPNDVKRIFKTAMEIDWIWHVRHQAAFQRHTDNAVSKTINLPNSATIEDVESAFWHAYEAGCKSITVYRDGSREVQVLENTSAIRKMCPNCNAILFMNNGEQMCVTCGYKPPVEEGILGEPEETTVSLQTPLLTKDERPEALSGKTYRKHTPLGTAFVTINSSGKGNQDPFEVFLNVGKAGSDIFAISEALGRLMSLILRIPTSIHRRERLRWIADELRGIGGVSSLGFGINRTRSLPDGLAQIFFDHLDLLAQEVSGQNMNGSQKNKNGKSPQIDLCPDCGEATLVYAEGCRKCHSCGYSDC